MKVTRWLNQGAFGTLAVIGALSLGACTGQATPATNTSTPPPAVGSAPVTQPGTAPPVTTPPAAPVTAAYDAARVEWQGGATASSADEGRFWANAVTDLTHGETTDTAPTGYAAAIIMLNELISLPDAQQSPAQNAAYHTDLNALNDFFKTPGLYS